CPPRPTYRRDYDLGHRMQRETAPAGLDRRPLVLDLDRHVGAVGQRAQDVEQLARRNGRAAVFLARTELRRGLDLDLDVGGEEGHVLAVLAQQHVGQDRQRVASLDNAGHGLQGLQDRIAVGFDELHCFRFLLLLLDVWGATLGTTRPAPRGHWVCGDSGAVEDRHPGLWTRSNNSALPANEAGCSQSIPRLSSPCPRWTCRPSSAQGLVEHVQLAVPLLVVLAQLGDALDGVHHGGVVTAAEGFADLGETLLRQLLREVHR